MRSILFGFSLLSLTLHESVAFAQDVDFGEGEEDNKKKKREGKKVDIDRDVREIERGLYTKANVGAMIYVLQHRSVTVPVHSLALSIGNDFVDREKTSMAWEVSFLQTVHNGTAYYDQASYLANPADFIQGDTRGFALTAAYEFAKYPTRRIGLGGRVIGGVMAMPVLMHDLTYSEAVVAGTWGLGESPNHRKAYIPVGGGLGLEYYTKLAHFSVGVDIDALYILGFDLGLNTTGYMKYSF